MACQSVHKAERERGGQWESSHLSDEIGGVKEIGQWLMTAARSDKVVLNVSL